MRSFIVRILALLAIVSSISLSAAISYGALSTAELHQAKDSSEYAGTLDLPLDRSYHGFYSKSRQALHESLVAQALASANPTASEPEIVFMSGPFATGKTTVLKILENQRLLNCQDYVKIDMDEIRKKLPEFLDLAKSDAENAAHLTQKESGYIAELILWQALKEGRNVLVDSSLRNAEYFKTLQQKILQLAPKYRGHFKLLYVRSDLNTVLQRVEERNSKDTRFTPALAAKESYFASEKSFDAVRMLFNDVVVIDNSLAAPKLIYTERNTPNGRVEKGQNLVLDSAKLAGAANGSVDLFDRLNSIAANRPKASGFDIFMDLDWTLFSKLQDPNEAPASERVELKSDRGIEYFRAADHSVEVLTSLLKLPGMRLHVISGGSEERNKLLLKSIRFQDGTTLLEHLSSLHSMEALTPISEEKGKGFAERFAKYLQRLSDQFDMRRTVLFDDLPKFSRFGLKVIMSHGEFFYQRSFDPAKAGQPYYPRTEMEFNNDKHRMRMFESIVKEAYQADLAGKGDFATIAENLSKDPVSGKWHALTSPAFQRFFAEKNLNARSSTPRTCESLFAAP